MAADGCAVAQLCSSLAEAASRPRFLFSPEKAGETPVLLAR
jgi:hypothetical protein